MNFLYPGFLFALAAIAIPIIIHLFNFRKYKKVFFSNVRFLKEVQQETQSRNKLKQLLILISRILAIACIVFAFAQPFIPGRNQDKNLKGDKAVSVYIDNSYSMEPQDAESRGRLIDIAVRYAGQIGEVIGEADRIQILTSDFEGRHQVFYSPDEYDNLLTEIQLTHVARPLSEVCKRQIDLLNKSGAQVKRAYILSDFQKTISDFNNFPADSSVVFQLIPLIPANSDNLYIDSCWLMSPEVKVDEPLTMMVRVVNLSQQDFAQIPLQLSINGEQKPVSFSIAANSTTDVEVHFTVRNTGFQEGKLSLVVTNQQISFDNDFYFSFELLDQINIQHIRGNSATGYIHRLFAGDDYFQLITNLSSNIDFASFGKQQLIILDEVEEISSSLTAELTRFVESGGSIFVVPPAKGTLKGYPELFSALKTNRFMSPDTTDTKIAPIESGNPFFQDVFESIPENMDMPVIRKHYAISNETRSMSETLLKMRNGRKFLSREKPGNGYVYLLAVSLEESYGNFPRHAIFVPSLIKAAFSSQPIGKLYHTVGRNEFIQIPVANEQKEKVYKMRKGKDGQEFIPEQRRLNASAFLYLGNNVSSDGIYDILMDAKVIGKSALNYDRKESVPDSYTKDEIEKELSNYNLENFYTLLRASDETFKKVLMETEQGVRLWKLFIIFALVFLAVEILLIRFLK